MRAWILFKAQEVLFNLFSNVRIKLAKVSLRSGSDLCTVRQKSVSGFLHKIAERNRPLLLRFFQGNSRVFYIDSICFLLGETLEKPKILYRNQGGEILAAARHNRAFLPISRPVYHIREHFASFRYIQARH